MLLPVIWVTRKTNGLHWVLVHLTAVFGHEFLLVGIWAELTLLEDVSADVLLALWGNRVHVTLLELWLICEHRLTQHRLMVVQSHLTNAISCVLALMKQFSHLGHTSHALVVTLAGTNYFVYNMGSSMVDSIDFTLGTFQCYPGLHRDFEILTCELVSSTKLAG